MAANRSRTAGHNWERDCVNKLRYTGFFPNVYTTRMVSRYKDNLKIDIANADESEFGELPYYIQTKTIVGQPNYKKVLEELPIKEGTMRVFFHKRTKKVGTRFMPDGEFAFLELENFIKLIAELERYKQAFNLINDIAFDSLDDEFKPELHKQLEELGL